MKSSRAWAEAVVLGTEQQAAAAITDLHQQIAMTCLAACAAQAAEFAASITRMRVEAEQAALAARVAEEMRRRHVWG